MEKNFLARVTAIISDFKRNIRTAQRMAKTDIPDEIKTEVTANIRDYQGILELLNVWLKLIYRTKSRQKLQQT
ncbi:hypothetical protein [Staphylococcus aureus]|uniref:hypothetical protein n=1 Tax=Staphylococcus aureus TaxID=1280 RepID=UPI003999924B